MRAMDASCLTLQLSILCSWHFQTSTLHNPSRHYDLQSRIQSFGGVLLYADTKNKYASLIRCDDKVCQSPWFIAYDIYSDAIVLSIRGSKTAKDVATDCKTSGFCRIAFSLDPILLHYTDKCQPKEILSHRV